MQGLFILMVCIVLGQPAVAGETVYLCRQNGKVTYTASPRLGKCQPVDLKVLHPSDAELERLAREKERQDAEAKALEEQQRQERQVRAQEETARAARRQARAAERGAAYEREQLRVQEKTYDLERNRQPLLVVPRRASPRAPVPQTFPAPSPRREPAP